MYKVQGAIWSLLLLLSCGQDDIGSNVAEITCKKVQAKGLIPRPNPYTPNECRDTIARETKINIILMIMKKNGVTTPDQLFKLTDEELHEIFCQCLGEQ